MLKTPKIAGDPFWTPGITKIEEGGINQYPEETLKVLNNWSRCDKALTWSLDKITRKVLFKLVLTPEIPLFEGHWTMKVFSTSFWIHLNDLRENPMILTTYSMDAFDTLTQDIACKLKEFYNGEDT